MPMRGSTWLVLSPKPRPLAISIAASSGRAIRYLKKRTESGFMLALYSGRANSGLVP